MRAAFPLAFLFLLVCAVMIAAPANSDELQLQLPNERGDWTTPTCKRISGTSAVTYTTDEGLTLAKTQATGMAVYCYGLETLDVGNTIIASLLTNNGSAILRSQDAGCTWQTIANLSLRRILNLEAAPGGKAYVWAEGESIFYLLDGTSLTTLAAPDEMYGLAVDPQDASHIRIGGQDCQIYESNDGGLNFFAVGQPANTGLMTFFTVDFNPQDWDCALCGTKGAWRTADAGQSWQPIEPFELEDVDLVYQFVFSKDDPQRVWARANLETVTNYSRNILTSNDGGVSFVSVIKAGDELPDQNGILREVFMKNISPIAPLPGQPDVVYSAAGSSYQDYGTLLYRYDAGTNQTRLVHIPGLDDINAIKFNPADASVMYLGIENDPKQKLESVTAIAEDSEQVTVSASPNPFNPTVNICFNLPAAAQVKLEVYNIKGQVVATPLNTFMSAGEHSVTWDGSRFASGIYLYRLQAGETTRTNKMMLLK